MILITVRDVLWRWRRFLIALLATALVLALTLILDGVSRSFGNEASVTVAAIGADGWLVPEGATSVFLSSAVLPADTLVRVAAAPNVTGAAAIAVVHADLRVHPDDEVTALTLVGTSDIGSSDTGSSDTSKGVRRPPLHDGRWPAASGEATAERSLGVDLGDTITVSGHPFTVVGHTDGVTVTAGVPVSFVALEDAQAIGYAGAPLATAIAVTGHPEKAPAELSLLTNDAVRSDLLVPLKDAVSTIQLILDLLWLVAVMVIGSVVYLTSLDRTRDFAVLKATGATNRSLLGGLALQAGILSGGAAVMAVVLAQRLAPAVPMQTHIEPTSYAVLFGVALGVAILSSLVSVRRTMKIDPALAFGGA